MTYLEPPMYIGCVDKVISIPIINEFMCCGYVSFQFTSGTKYINNSLSLPFSNEEEYVPSELSVDSYVRGLAKCVHPQTTIKFDEYYVLSDWLVVILGPFMFGEMWSKERAYLELDPDKASGAYWRKTVGPKKFDVMLKYDPDDLLSFFRTHTSVYSTSLKDELRLKNKLARLFCPGPIELIFTGNLLFGAQNERLTKNVLRHPITIGISVPGAQMNILYQTLLDFGNSFKAKCYDADASAWDMSFMSWVARLCRDVRCRMYKQSDYEVYVKDVLRYYDATQYGWCDFLGYIIMVCSQKSGHTNTAIDNSIGNLAMMCLHALHVGYSLDEFRQHVIFYCNGDDVLYATDSSDFTIVKVAETYRFCGIFFESDGIGKSVFDCYYLSTCPVYKYIRGSRYLIPKYKRGKIVSSFHYWKKGSSDLDHLSKLVALVMLSFGDEELYLAMKKYVSDWVVEQQRKGVCFETKSFASYLRLLTDDTAILRIYTSSE